MESQTETGEAERKPLIVLFSPRERVRDILAVGLTQCNYEVALAETSYLASIKANQFLPGLIIVDLTPENTQAVHLITRLQLSVRTRNICVLVIVPRSLRHILDSISEHHTSHEVVYHVVEYPFHFADLLKKINAVFKHDERGNPAGDLSLVKPGGAVDEHARDAIARELFDPNISRSQKLADIEAAILKQWGFPFSVVKALNIIESNESCVNELAKCISTDPGSSAAILRVTNTVQYAKRGKRVTEIHEAVVRLGFQETRNLLACLSLINLSPELYQNYGFSRHEFWLHSLACGLIAEKLCADMGHRRPELAFIAGLIHDIGKIPIDNNFSSVFSRLLEETANRIMPFYMVEKELTGFTHAELGHHLATEWNFPESISLSILNHHDPDRVLATRTPLDRFVQESVYVANILAKAACVGHSCDEIVPPIPSAILRDLRIPNGPDDRFFAGIHRRLYFLCRDLGISLKDMVIGSPNPQHRDIQVVAVVNAEVPFHPAILSLKSSGFCVKVAQKYLPEVHQQAQVVLAIPEKGSPIDIMLLEDETNEPRQSSTLKIFLLDVVPEKKMLKGFADTDIVFFDKHNLDLRVLLHTIDSFVERVVVPASTAVDGQVGKV